MFWHPLFWFIIEAALVSVWLLYKATCELAMLPVHALNIPQKHGFGFGC
jgi:hypothetical protein